MEVFVHRNDDYEFLVLHDEAVGLSSNVLESTVMTEGEIPTHVMGVLRMDVSQKEKITFKDEPESVSWSRVERTVVTLNSCGYEQVLSEGGILLGGISRDVYVKDSYTVQNV